MPQVVGIDHIAITMSDLEATCAFYDRLFGARTHLERVADGKVQVPPDRPGRWRASQRSPSRQ